jgi:hypothetical protein
LPEKEFLNGCWSPPGVTAEPERGGKFVVLGRGLVGFDRLSHLTNSDAGT